MNTGWILAILAAVFFAGTYVWRKRGIEITQWWKERKTVSTTAPTPTDSRSFWLGSVRFVAYLLAFIMVPKLLWDFFTGLVGVPPFLVDVVNGLLYAFDATVVLFLLIAPYIAPALKTTVQTPNHIYLLPLFADLESGRAKAVVTAGDNATRYLMDYVGYGFRGTPLEGEPDDTRWDIVPNGVNFDARNVWERYVRKVSGLVFVGIYPWRSIKHYNIDITKVTTDENGNRKPVIRIGEKSDHVRVREFDWALKTTVVIQGLFRITILYAFRLQCENPAKLLFGVDRWFNSFANNVGGRTTQELQSMTLEEVLSASEKQKTQIADAIMKICEEAEPFTLKAWGLRIKQVLVVKFLFDELTDKERESLTAEVVADRNAKAAIKTYKAEEEGEAGIIKARLDAMAASPLGEAASRHAALETAAEGKGTTLVFDSAGGGTSDTNTKLLKAILTALQKKGDDA